MNLTKLGPTSPFLRGTVVPLLSPHLCQMNHPGFLLYRAFLSFHNVLTALSQIHVTFLPQLVQYYKLLQDQELETVSQVVRNRTGGKTKTIK